MAFPYYYKLIITIIVVCFIAWISLLLSYQNSLSDKKSLIIKSSKSSQRNPDEIDHSKYLDSTEEDPNNSNFAHYNLVPYILSNSKTEPIVAVPLKKFKMGIRNDMNILNKFPVSLKYKNKYLTTNISQGLCGSCWVFSVLAVLADKVCLYSKGLRSNGLSVQQVLSCYTNKDGCDGDSPEDLAIWLEKTRFKIQNRSEMPYKQVVDSVIYTECPLSISGIQIEKNSMRSITEFVEEENLNYRHTLKDKALIEKNVSRMKTELLLRGPFYAVISIKKNFYEYTGNDVYISDPKSDVIGGHAIEVIGYGKNQIDQTYWICRNFWSDWPTSTKDGIFKLKMGMNSAGIESRCGSLDPVMSMPKIIYDNVFD
jgi:hypothetical protein